MSIVILYTVWYWTIDILVSAWNTSIDILYTVWHFPVDILFSAWHTSIDILDTLWHSSLHILYTVRTTTLDTSLQCYSLSYSLPFCLRHTVWCNCNKCPVLPSHRNALQILTVYCTLWCSVRSGNDTVDTHISCFQHWYLHVPGISSRLLSLMNECFCATFGTCELAKRNFII